MQCIILLKHLVVTVMLKDKLGTLFASTCDTCDVSPFKIVCDSLHSGAHVYVHAKHVYGEECPTLYNLPLPRHYVFDCT